MLNTQQHSYCVHFYVTPAKAGDQSGLSRLQHLRILNPVPDSRLRGNDGITSLSLSRYLLYNF